MTEGILFRGAISIGNIIHEDNGLVMGQALIDAYLLETNAAKEPRIILSKKLLEKLNYPLTTKRNRYPYHQYISRFDDGCVGFHQMIYYQVIDSWYDGISRDKLKSELKKIKTTIIQGLDSTFEYPEIHKKYQWLKKEYDMLIFNEEETKEKIYDLNEGIAGQNIQYSYVDNFYFPKSNN